MTRFIDFKLLKQQLSFEVIFDHYGLKPIKDGVDHVKLCCPFHDDKRPSLGVHTGKRIWQCFACGKSGNNLEFIAYVEGLDPNTKDGIRQAAEKAAEILGIGEEGKPAAAVSITHTHSSRPTEIAKPIDTPHETEASDVEPDGENKPLTFELKLDRSCQMLRDRGFSPKTYERFGVGIAKRGMMKNRVCFPLREPDGVLVGYAGRWSDGEPPEGEPRYLLPKDLNKSRILWNWDRVRVWEPTHVVIVEGFWSVLRLDEACIPTVALMGHKLFDSQIDMLVSAGVKTVTLIFDGDEPGRAAADKASASLAKHLFVRSIVLPDDEKPDTMPEEILQQLPRCE